MWRTYFFLFMENRLFVVLFVLRSYFCFFSRWNLYMKFNHIYIYIYKTRINKLHEHLCIFECFYVNPKLLFHHFYFFKPNWVCFGNPFQKRMRGSAMTTSQNGVEEPWKRNVRVLQYCGGTVSIIVTKCPILNDYFHKIFLHILTWSTLMSVDENGLAREQSTNV